MNRLIDLFFRFLKRFGRESPEIWRDLETIRSIDRARKSLVPKILLVVVGFLFLAPFIVELDQGEEATSGTHGNDDIEQTDESYLIGFMFLLLVPLFGDMMVEMSGSFFPWKHLYSTPISRRSMELYKRFRVIQTRWVIAASFSIIVGWWIVVLYPDNYTQLEFAHVITRVFLATLVWTGILTWLIGIFPEHLKKLEHLRTHGEIVITIFFFACMGSLLLLALDGAFRGDMGALRPVTYWAMLPIWIVVVFTFSILYTFVGMNMVLFILMYGVLGIPFVLAVDRKFLKIKIQDEKIGIEDRSYDREKHDSSGSNTVEAHLRSSSSNQSAPDDVSHDAIRSTEGEDRENYLKRCMDAQEEFGTGFDTMLSMEPIFPKPRSLTSIVNVLIGLILFGLIFALVAFCCFLLISIVGIVLMLIFMGMHSAVNWHFDPLSSISDPHPYLRLLPEDPEKVVSEFEKNIWQGLPRIMGAMSIPLALMMIIPFGIPFIGGRHPSEYVIALIVLSIVPLHIQIFKFIHFDGIGAKNLEPSRWYGIRFYLYFFIGIPYLFVIFYKFDFLNNVLMSWIFHLFITIVLLSGSRELMRHQFMDYLGRGASSDHGDSHGSEKNIRIGIFHTSSREGRLEDILLATGFILILIFMAWPGETDYRMSLIENDDRDLRYDQIPYGNATEYNASTEIVGENMSFRSNVIINSSVSFRDSVIRFRSDRSGEIGLYVLPMGSLELVNVTITSDSYFRWEVFGNLTIHRSNITRVWGDTDHPDYEGGIEVYSDREMSEVRIENTTISDGITNGILIGESYATLVNCTFHGIEGDAIELIRSRGQFRDTHITDVHVGIFMRDSKATFVNTTIKDVSVWTVSKDVDSDPTFDIYEFIGPEKEGLEQFVHPIYVDVTYLMILTGSTAVMINDVRNKKKG